MMPLEGRGPEVLDTLTDPLALDERKSPWLSKFMPPIWSEFKPLFIVNHQ